MCFLTITLHAQTENSLFTPIKLPKKMNDEQTTMVTKIEKYPNVKNVQYVTVNDYTKFVEGAYLVFTVPNEVNPVKAKIKRSEISENGDYVLYAICDSLQGEISLIKKNQLAFGTFSFKENIYRIYGIGKNLSALLTLGKGTQTAKCGNDIKTETIPNTSATNQMNNQPEVILPCNDVPVITIACYYTTAADNKDPSIGQTAVIAINDFRNALQNSSVILPIGIGLFDVRHLPDFNEQSGFIDDDLNKFISITESERNAFHVDLRVLLTDGNYDFGNLLGKVPEGAIPAESNNAVAIVEVEHAVTPSEWVFTHELGHLFGGRHEFGPGAIPSTARGMAFDFPNIFSYYPSTMKAHSIMHQLVDNTWNWFNPRKRILTFTNPDMSFLGVPLGDPNCCNVAAEIRRTAPIIANFKSEPLNLSTSILGTSHILQSGTYYWEPQISCGNGPYITTWDVMSPNGNILMSRTVSNDELLRLDFYPYATIAQYHSLTIRMTVRSSDNQVLVNFLIVVVDQLYNIVQQNNPRHNEEMKSKNLEIGNVFPNPANSKIVVDYTLNQNSEVKIHIFNSQGIRVHELDLGNQTKNYYQREIDVSEFSAGMYNCLISSGSTTQTKKFVITH